MPLPLDLLLPRRANDPPSGSPLGKCSIDDNRQTAPRIDLYQRAPVSGYWPK
jgi:hypothetical protein